MVWDFLNHQFAKSRVAGLGDNDVEGVMLPREKPVSEGGGKSRAFQPMGLPGAWFREHTSI